MVIKAPDPYKRPKGTIDDDGSEDEQAVPAARKGGGGEGKKKGPISKVCFEDFEVRSPLCALLQLLPPAGSIPHSDIPQTALIEAPFDTRTPSAQPMKVIGNGCFGKVCASSRPSPPIPPCLMAPQAAAFASS